MKNRQLAQKLYIKTYGCQMNVYDSGRMADVLAPLGYTLVDTPEGADMVIKFLIERSAPAPGFFPADS